MGDGMCAEISRQINALRRLAWGRVWFAALSCLFVAPVTARAAGPLESVVAGQTEIEVQVPSGRVFRAVVDPKSDGETLWLRFGGERARVLRPVRWSSVQSVSADGQTLTVSELQRVVASRTNAGGGERKATAPRPKRRTEREPGSLARREADTAQHFTATFEAWADRGLTSETGRAVVPRVRSVLVDARAANWDGDVQTDGLIVYLQPLDEVGNSLAVRGDVSFNLVGNYPSVIHQPQPLTRLASWTRRVRSDGMTPRGMMFKLPFQAVHPDLQTNVGPYALLHCRLSVPGHGTFDETVDVRIRQASPLRDQLQKLTGSRFHPLESLGRTR